MIEQLPPHAPDDLIYRLQQVQNGDTGGARPALEHAGQYINLHPIAVEFRDEAEGLGGGQARQGHRRYGTGEI